MSEVSSQIKSFFVYIVQCYFADEEKLVLNLSLNYHIKEFSSISKTQCQFHIFMANCLLQAYDENRICERN